MKQPHIDLMGYEDFERVAMLAVAAREHVLLLGPPGVAKSLAVRRFTKYLDGACFAVQLSKFDDQSALFGLPDMKTLRETGEVVYPVRGFADARYALLDEIFDGSDVVLRTLLAPLEERILMRGKDNLPLPLRTVFGTANYTRENEIIAAVIDRFALTVCAPQLSETDRAKLYDGTMTFEDMPAPTSKLTVEQLEEVRKRSKSVTIAPGVVEIIMEWCKANGMSPRRERKLGNLLRVSAALDGRDEVSEKDIDVCRFVLHARPEMMKPDWKGKEHTKALREQIKEMLNQEAGRAEIADIIGGVGDVSSDWDGVKELASRITKLKDYIDTTTKSKAGKSIDRASKALEAIKKQHRELAMFCAAGGHMKK